MSTPRVLVPLAQGCEELEAVTVIDLLRRAGLTVISAGLDQQPVVASRGVTLLPDTTLDEVLDADFDLIVLPGGLKGAQHLCADARIETLMMRVRQQGGALAAICAAPTVLAAAGLLDGKKVTGYPGTLDKLDLQGTEVVDQAVVVDGRIITSRGPGTALDFALTLIELLAGRSKRDEVETALVRA